MLNPGKDWDQHVQDAEELARTPGFQRLRDRIVALAQPRPDDVVVDVGAGTGLLTLALAPSVERVWALDISPAMVEYLSTKAASADFDHVEVTTATATSLPLVDHAASLLVSNYCLHHLPDAEKQRALREAFRVLRPGGRVVIGDMMFTLQLSEPRNRRLVLTKVKAILRRGPAGVVRLLKNAVRLVTRRWEHPADPGWWRAALEQAGFENVRVHLLEQESGKHEGGIVTAVRPATTLASRRLMWRSGSSRRTLAVRGSLH
jgi:ubiquinone/menaquinone biosynthesis C-methylase UbiE